MRAVTQEILAEARTGDHAQNCKFILDFVNSRKGINVRMLERESGVARGTISLFKIGERPNIPKKHVHKILKAIREIYNRKPVPCT